MPAYLITGLPGAGKTTVIEELQRRGFNAHSTDENGLTSFYDTRTGKRVPESFKIPVPIDSKLFAWEWDIPRLKTLLTSGGAVFVGGITNNTIENLNLFDKIFVPHPSRKTLTHRITTRTNNTYGKHPEELAFILSEHAGSEVFWRSKGAIIIDADQPLAKVADDILTHITA